MNLTNYHTHTIFSDGNSTAEEMIKLAIEKNIKILGFSDHSPVPFFSEWNMKFEKLLEYVTEIRRLKLKYIDEIEIYLGMEVDNIQNIANNNYWNFLNLDYKIGSVHYLKTFEDGKIFNFDSSKEEFARGLELIFEKDIKKLIKFYYQQINEMLINNKPDFVGHFDLITKFNKNSIFFDETQKWYHDIVNETLEIVKQTNSVLEVNTRGFYRNLSENYFPNNWILNICKDLKIPLIVNSDAHHVLELDFKLINVYILLKEIGYKQLRLLKNNCWNDFSFNENGFILK